jgi:hypothetical protein
MTQVVIVDSGVADGEPVKAISYLEPVAAWDSGYAVFSGEPGDDTDTALVCLHCLLDEHPEAREGMDLARECGVAVPDGDGWTIA